MEEFQLFLTNQSSVYGDNESTKFTVPLCFPLDFTDGKWMVALTELGMDNYAVENSKEQRKGQPLLIYSSICECRLTGPSMGQLLAATFVNVNEKDSPFLRVTVKHPFYTPIVSENVAYPTFTLRTEDGKPFPIDKNAKVYLTLHIRKLY